MALAGIGMQVRITRSTRADLRKPGADRPDIQSVSPGQELTVCNDTAEALIGTGSAVTLSIIKAPAKEAKPPPPPIKAGRISPPKR
jgi:hypothetical protein